MIGRGALAMPNLARDIRRALGLSVITVPSSFEFPETTDPLEWESIFSLYGELQPSEKRLKQWVRYLAQKREVTWWNEIKGLGSVKEILIRLKQSPGTRSSALLTSEHPGQTEP